MFIFCTEIQAIDPLTGEMKEWCGPNIQAISWQMAEQHCREKLGYCKVVGILESEIPCNDDMSPNFDNETRFDNYLN